MMNNVFHSLFPTWHIQATEDLGYFRHRCQDLRHNVRGGKFGVIQEIEHECKLLQELAEDMNLQEEVILWRKECKKLEYIREEFGNNKSAWEYVKGMFGKKGVLNDGDLRQMNKDIASIAKIHGRRRSSSRERSPAVRFTDRRQGQFYFHNNPFKTAPGLCFECGSSEHFKRVCPMWRGRGQRGRGRESFRGGRGARF